MTTTTDQNLLAVDLFAGTGSFTKAALAQGMTVRSFDILPLDLDAPRHLHSHETGDIREALVPESASILWASPPCEGFSVAAIGKAWNLDKETGDRTPKSDTARLGLELLRETIRIIAETKPHHWVIENPRGMMRKVIEPILLAHGLTGWRRDTVTYCQYGDDRMKPTDLWHNIEEWEPRPACKNGDPCHVAAPRGSRTGTQGRGSYLDKSRVPEELVNSILQAHLRSSRMAEHDEACETCEGTMQRLCPECQGNDRVEDRWCYRTESHYTVDVICQHCEGTHVVPCRDC